MISPRSRAFSLFYHLLRCRIEDRMSYVTQGTVQIEIKNGADSEIRINPAQEYSLRRDGKTFTIFINYDPEALKDPEALIFDAAKLFTAESSNFLQPLIEAAAKQTKIEITIKDRSRSIQSLKIPATL